jgi:hypothetical protein
MLTRLFVLALCGLIPMSWSTPKSSVNWAIQEPDDGVKFSGRNGTHEFEVNQQDHSNIRLFFFFVSVAHASCVFKGEIWLTGGRTAEYVTWNLYDSYKVADVWHSVNGSTCGPYAHDTVFLCH